MRVAVTGGSGHLGTVVLRRLAREPTVEGIVSLDLRPPVVAHPKVTHRVADIRDVPFDHHLEGADVLVHLAFVVDKALSRPLYEAINVEGSKNVFRAAARCGIGHVVYTSSISAYGIVPGHPEVIVEETPRKYQDDFPYAAAKYKVEEFLDGFETEHPSQGITRLRPGPAMGVSMNPSFSRGIRRRTVVDRGDVPKFLVWDEDVADAVWLAIESRARGAFLLVPQTPILARETIGIGSFRALRIPLWILALHFKVTTVLGSLVGRPGIDPSWITAISVPLRFSGERARRVLGWKPRCATAADVIRRCDDTIPYQWDPRIRRFLLWIRMATILGQRAPEGIADGLRFHLSVLGRGGGDVCLGVRAGGVQVGEEIPRPPGAVIQMWDRDLAALLEDVPGAGISIGTSAALMEGDASGERLLAALIECYRQSRAQPGLAGRARELLARVLWGAWR